jgi:Amt family ammonium transporter
MHYIPGLRLRASEEAEILGIDDAEMGEFAYDYVGLEQEIGHSLDIDTKPPSLMKAPETTHTSDASVDEKEQLPIPEADH